MYDIVFVDIPYINYDTDDELEHQMKIYRRECDFIIKQRTGVNAVEKKLYYSMGILCLSSYLKASMENIEIGYIHYYINMSEFEHYAKNSSIIAFSTMTVTINTVLKLAQLAFEINPNIKIILGGYHASYFACEILNTYEIIDCIFLHEGEQALLEYILNKEKELIHGIAFRNKKKKIILNDFNRYIESNSIPTPDYTLIVDNFQEFNIQLSTMRGCIGSCNFCVNRSYWSCPRLIPIEKVINELLYLKEHLKKGTVIHIIDNIFTLDKQRLKTLYFNMKHSNLLGYFKFECDTLSTLIDAESVKLLEDIGVFKICLGIEDCNDEILKNANKSATFFDNIRAVQIIKNNNPNICVFAYWIIGLPGTTIETLEENIFQMADLIEGNLVDIISPKIFVPYPGTQFFKHPETYGINLVSYNWDLYERRNPPFPYHYNELSDKELYIYLIKAFEICHEAYVNKYKSEMEGSDEKLGL